MMESNSSMDAEMDYGPKASSGQISSDEVRIGSTVRARTDLLEELH